MIINSKGYKMTKQMKQFLTELADLLEKHDVELEATEHIRHWSSYVDGIECSMTARYNEDNPREHCDIKLPIFTAASDIRDVIKELND